MSLWGNIKGKVKKLGLSFRSRSSWASSGSRDDMSVDSVRRPSRSQEEEEEAPASPAVPRPHLKIRVLTLVDQIVIRTDYEQDALELLKKQSYGHAKRFDTEFLMMTGLRQDMNRAFTTMGWSRFADITEPVIFLCLSSKFSRSSTIETMRVPALLMLLSAMCAPRTCRGLGKSERSPRVLLRNDFSFSEATHK